MYFKVKIESKIGIKFKSIAERGEKCVESALQLADVYGSKSIRGNNFSVWGGISSFCEFDNPNALDSKIWKEVRKGEYFPKMNTKIGKSINAEIDNLNTISKIELNNIVGLDGEDSMFSSIGFNRNNKEYFGFTTWDNSGYQHQEDCIEITETEYKELFKL